MRLILIALCLALANASYFGKNRFNRMLNRHDTPEREQRSSELYGSDDVDDFVDDYVDEIRRQRSLEGEQCPRDTDQILGQWRDGDESEYEQDDEQQEFGGEHDRYEERPRHRGENSWGEEERFGGRRGNQWNEKRQPWTGENDEETELEYGSPMLNEVREANCKLAARLYKESKDEKDDKNVVVSPLSIQLALAALNYGTRGTTRRQIGRVIAGNLKRQERRQVFKTLTRRLKGLHNTEYSTVGRKCQIKPVTGIFITQTTTTRGQQNFMQLIKNNLGATVKHCDFHRQPQQCRQMINRWMSQRTQEKLPSIVPQDAITDNTKMILINSMHVKASWGPQMRRHQTKEAKFYPLDTKKVKIVEVMETQGRFKYHEDELVKIVGVPTQDKEMTLYVIVPREKDGLTEVEKLHLQDGVQLKQLLKQVDQRVRHVGVQLPKFQIKHKIDVRRTLRKQGVTDAFDPLRADFSGITGVSKTQQVEYEDSYRTNNMEEGGWSTGGQETKLHLNKFIHQSTIKITESGITATTGSGSNFEERGHNERTTPYGRYGHGYGEEEQELNPFEEISGFSRGQISSQKMVKANRAFAFVLKHNPTNQLVFVGRVIDAAQKKITQVPETINVVDQY